MASTAELAIIISAKDSASKQIDGLGKSLGALGGVGKVATAALAGIATAGVGLVAGIGAAVNTAATFESAMSAVGAVAGASGQELAALSAKALALGQDTTLAGIGASDAAAAMQALAAGGVKTEDILNGAARGALLLASAGGIDVPRAAEIAANAMTSFGLAGTDVAHIADLLSAAANASSADVGDLGESLKFVAPVAHSMGLSIEEVVATLTEFGAQGIKGSQAGTSLRSIIASLANPSKIAAKSIADLGLEFFDAGGHMKSIAGISEELKTKMAGLTDQERAGALAQIFGNEALSAATILYGEGAAGITKYLEQVTVAGSAATNGALRNDNLRGSIEQLKSSWETATIVLGQAFLPAVRGVVDAITGAVNAAIPFVQQYGPVLVAALQQGIGAVIGFGREVSGAVGAVVGSFLKLKDGQITLGQFIGGMEIFATTIRDRLAGLAAQAAPYIGQFFSAIGSAIATYAPQIAAQFGQWAGSFVSWIQDAAIPFLAPRLAAFLGAVTDWVTGTAIPTVTGAVVGLATALADWVTTQAIPFLQAALPAWGAALWGWITGTAVPTVTGAVVGLARALGDWIGTQAVPFLQANLPAWGEALWGYIRDTAVPTVTGQVVALANALSDWVETQAIPRINEKMPGFTSALVSQIQSSQATVNASAEQMGRDLGDKLGEGMIAGGGAAIGKAVANWQSILALAIPGMAAGSLAGGTNIGINLGEGLSIGGLKSLYVAIATFEATLFAMLAGMVAPVQVYGLHIGIGLVQSLLNGIESKAGELWAWLSSLPGRIVAAVGDLGGVLYAQGVAVVQGFINGINSKIGEAASAAANLAGLVSGGVLDHFIIKSPSKLMADIGNDVVDGLILGMDEQKGEAAKKAADVAQAVSEGVRSVLESIRALAQFDFAKNAVSEGSLGAFALLMRQIVTAIVEASDGFKDEALKAAGSFSDAAKKVADFIVPALTGLQALASFDFATGGPSGAALGWFTHLVESLVANTVDAASHFTEEGLTAAGLFADTAKKVADFIGPSLTALAALAQFDFAKNSPTGSAMGWFFHLVESLVANTVTAASHFTSEGLAAAGLFADTAKKVADFIVPGLTALAALAKYDFAKNSPTGEAMGWFTHLVASMVKNFELAAQQFTTEGLAAVGRFAEAAGKVVAVIPPALTGLTALSAYVSPPRAVVDDFLAMVKYVVGKFGEMAQHLETEGVKKMGDFADAAGKALSAAKTGTDLFKAFDKLVVPSKVAIDNLLIAVFYIVDQFGRIAAKLETEGIQRMQDFAAAAGQSLTAAKTGADLFKEMEKLAVPSRQAIDNLLEGIKAVVLQMGVIADQIGVAGLQKAQDFATKSSAVFTTFKASLDLLSSLKEYKQLPLDAINALIDGMKQALAKMGELQGAASAFLQQADTFAGTMRDAARKIAEGIALGGAIPDTVSGPSTGGGPGGGRRAAGGPVAAGLSYLVGERGPELFVPGGAGTILPSSSLQGGGPTVVNTYNLTFTQPVYGVDHLEDVVVSVMGRAEQRGRLSGVLSNA